MERVRRVIFKVYHPLVIVVLEKYSLRFVCTANRLYATSEVMLCITKYFKSLVHSKRKK